MTLLILQLLMLLALLIINGEPLRAVSSRRLKFFSDLDFLQICILDVYVGGLILYLMAILPLGIFDWYVLIGFTLLSAILSVFLHSKTLIRWASFSELKASLAENRKTLLIYLLVFLMFVVFLSINLSSLSGLVFGSVRDESIHSLYVQVILENHSIPVTLMPYLPEGIIYPQASHVIFAFSSYMLNMEVPSVILYVSVLFKGLSIFGAYFLGRKLGQGVSYSLGLSFVFAFISSWPLNITWGANPFILGFPLFLVCLGFLYSMYRSTVKHNLAELFVIGLLFGYIGAIVISYLQTLIVIAFMIFVFYLFLERARIPRAFGEFAAIFGVAFIPLTPFLFRFFAFYSYPGHNIGLPQDFAAWTSQQSYLSQALQWVFDNMSPYLLPTVLLALPIASMFILLLRTKEYMNFNDNFISVIRFTLAAFAAGLLLSFASFFLPPDFNIVSWGHQGILLTIPINILAIASYMKFAEFVREGKFKSLSRVIPKGSRKSLFFTMMVLLLVTSPFLYYRFVADSENLRGAYNIYAVTSQSDYDLIKWMAVNLTSSDAVILVHPYGSGLFIPSVSHQKIVFPYTGSSLSASYQTLVGLLENNTLNANAYHIMRSLNVSYVFVGSNVARTSQNPPAWFPALFLGNPNFKLVKNFGTSYLFRLEERNQTTVFADDFEYAHWNLNGWLNYSSGYGFGNVTLNESFRTSRQLAITAQALPTAGHWELQYSYWVDRNIFLPYNNSDVTLTIHFDAIQGFGGNDTFAVLISNTQYSKMMIFATPNGVYQSYPSATILNSRRGSFNLDLSEKWQQLYNSSLPQTFVLQLINYDFDGTPSVAYVDNITITASPKATP